MGAWPGDRCWHSRWSAPHLSREPRHLPDRSPRASREMHNGADAPGSLAQHPREVDSVTAAALPVQPSPFAVLRKRAFVYIWSAQLVSTIGDALTSLAAGIIVYRLTGSA